MTISGMAQVGVLLLLPTTALAAGANPCSDAGGQQTMNACIADTVRDRDKALNRLYGEVTAKLDPLGKHNILEAERAWNTFRDKECVFRAGYDEDHFENDGTLAPYLVGECQLDLTNKRIDDMRAQLKCPGGNMACEN